MAVLVLLQALLARLLFMLEEGVVEHLLVLLVRVALVAGVMVMLVLLVLPVQLIQVVVEAVVLGLGEVLLAARVVQAS
jgi:hypothetical protein